MKKGALTEVRPRKSTTVTAIPQGAVARHFEFEMMKAEIEIDIPWAPERKLDKEIASLEQAGQLQVTAVNGRGEFAVAVISAGLA